MAFLCGSESEAIHFFNQMFLEVEPEDEGWKGYLTANCNYGTDKRRRLEYCNQASK